MSDTPTLTPPIPHQTDFDSAESVQLAASMSAQGVDPYEAVPFDYFAFDENVRVVLPRGTDQWVEIKQLSEGDRKKYLRAVNRDMKIQKGTGDAIMKLAAGEDRTALLRVAIVGWNLISGGQPVPFNPRNLDKFLDGRVEVLEFIEKAVRKHNPWLLSDVTVEDIDEQIAELQDLRIEILEREAGKSDSAI